MKVDRASILIASLLLGLTLPAPYSTVGTAQQAPDLISEGQFPAALRRKMQG